MPKKTPLRSSAGSRARIEASESRVQFRSAWLKARPPLVPSRAIRAHLAPLKVTPAAAWKTIRDAYLEHGSLRLDAFIKEDADLARRARALLETKTTPRVADAWVEAAAALPTNPVAFVDRWMSDGGLELAVCGVLAIVRFQAERSAHVLLRMKTASACIRLREHLARATDEDYARALSLAERALGPVLGARWRAGSLFPEHDAWVAQFVTKQRALVRENMYEIDNDDVRLLHASLIAWSDVKEHLGFWNRIRYPPSGKLWRAGGDAIFPQLVASGAVDAFVEEIGPELALAEHLGALPDDRAYGILLANRSSQAYAAALVDATRSFPRRATRLLEKAQRTEPRDKVLVRLLRLARSHAE
jgi:hypothetical protein